LPVCLLAFARWCFRDTHFFIVHSDLISIYTVVAGTVFILVFAIIDNYVADVVLLSLADFAYLVAYIALFSVVYFAVGDFGTALVVGDFNVFCLAVGAISRTFLICAVFNFWDTIGILREGVAVEALQAVAVAVVVLAVSDFRRTLALVD